MSSSETGSKRPRRRLIPAVLVGAALVLSACTVQPVYAPTPAGSAMSSVLSSISVDPVESRIGQQVRNALIFHFTGGAGGSTPVYGLRLSTSGSNTELGITRTGAAPVYSMTVAVTYELYRIETGEIIQRATARGTASYDRNSQAFSNIRARIDAEDRAAAVVADDIGIRIAALAAKGGLDAPPVAAPAPAPKS
jgi:LPS-assembly lipoprotein